MNEVLSQKLSEQSKTLTDSFQSSIESVRSDLEQEKAERVEAQRDLEQRMDHRMAALELSHSSQKHSNSSGSQDREYKKDPCMCVVGGLE